MAPAVPAAKKVTSPQKRKQESSSDDDDDDDSEEGKLQPRMQMSDWRLKIMFFISFCATLCGIAMIRNHSRVLIGRSVTYCIIYWEIFESVYIFVAGLCRLSICPSVTLSVCHILLLAFATYSLNPIPSCLHIYDWNIINSDISNK